ncbi:MAG: OmpA family protein [Desulfobacteraceae bacterium]|nr:OmpA family protein [Desulfobacteraceae bacterium]
MKKIIIFAICLACCMAVSLPSFAIELTVEAVKAKKVPASYATVKDGKIVYGKHATAYSPDSLDRILRAYELDFNDNDVNELNYPRYAKVKDGEIVFGKSSAAYDPGTYHKILSAYDLILPIENARALKDPPNYVKLNDNNKLIFGKRSTAYSPEEFNMLLNAYILPPTDKIEPRDTGVCPDADGDGVCDEEDDCPNEYGERDNRGCPKEKPPCPDSDRDGVCDEFDECPDTPAGKRVDVRGCPEPEICPDSDGDGVCDEDDQCPDTPMGTAVDEKTGCPPPADEIPTTVCVDADEDGVCDDRDACLGTPKGAFVNERGCWIIENLLFDFDKSVIKEKYYGDLEEVAKVLKENPDLVVEIQGHTCWVGTEKYNQGLSERRAKSVVKFLEDKGVDPARLSWEGYGESRPAFENTTREGRIKNRRVEMAPKH